MKDAPDPYFPKHGDLTYAVTHYDLRMRYKVETNRLRGVAKLSVRALRATGSLRFDLSGLRVEGVKENGRLPRKFRQGAHSLEVGLSRPLDAGEVAEVTVTYSGHPAPVPGPFGPAGWEELTDGVLVASQPYGAPSWFPCNDRADDKASYRFEVSADAGYTVVANGRLIAKTARGSRCTWTYDEPHPMSPYLASVSIGRQVTTVLREASDAAPPVAIVHPAGLRIAGTAFKRLPAMVDQLQDWFGRYPFAGYQAIIAADDLEIPLEAQGSACYGVNHAAPGWENERLVVHELAHQWFGNAVTARLGRDIWLHEGFACYTEWLWSERRGVQSAQKRAAFHWRGLAADPGGFALADPGVEHMFDDAVYKRGALTLHALRARIGDEAFFEVLRAWISEHRYGSVTTSEFTELAARVSGVDLTELFADWLDRPGLPGLPKLPG